MKTLLLAGGGHAHIEVLRRFGLERPGNARVVLVSPEHYAAYSGMLPGLVAGHYRWEECHVDLARLCSAAGAERAATRVVSIDLLDRRAVCADGRRLPFDLLSLDVGSTPDTRPVPGATEHALPVKPVAGFLESLERLLPTTPSGPSRRVVVVGGGAGGVEIALAIRHRTGTSVVQPKVSVVTNDLLPGHNRRVRHLVQNAMTLQGVACLDGRLVSAVEADGVVCGASERVDADAVIWATGAAAAPWLAASGLQTDRAGFVLVDPHLQSESHPWVFAAGDTASIAWARVPKSGVYAVRQGPVLAENLRRALDGRALTRYRPQRLALALISTGGRHAIASYGQMATGGRWVWRWKDRIDRTFVQRYSGNGTSSVAPA